MTAADLMLLNLGQFSSFQSIVIPSLVGISSDINPDETVHITADESSWLCKVYYSTFSKSEYKFQPKNNEEILFLLQPVLRALHIHSGVC